MNSSIESLGPIVDNNSKILILGSIPGKQSLEKQEYYGNSRNAFWKIIYSLYETDIEDDYDKKIKFVKEKNIALWDVIKNCSREGSLDSNIKNEEPNNFVNLIRRYPNIECVFFNGAKAHDVFKKQLGFDKFSMIKFEKLTSTSPANAIKFERKIEQWQSIKVCL